MPRNLFREQELSQGVPGAPGLASAREGSLGARALAGIPITPAGSVAALERMYGPGNVVTSEAGEIFIRDPAKNEFYPLNREGFSAGDVAGLSGVALEAGPAGIGAATVGGAAAGAVGGNLLRQGIAAGLGERAGLPERAQSVAIAGGLAGATQGAVYAGARVLNMLRPSTVAATALRATAGRGRFAAEAAKSDTIEQALGVAFTPGQRSQSKALLTLEGMLRRNPASADIILENDEAQLAAVSGALRRALERMRPGEVPSEAAGNTVKRVFDQTLDSALQLRRSQAAIDFGKVDAIAGSTPLIAPSNLRGEIDAIVRELDVPGGGDATAALVGKLKAMRSQLTTPAERSAAEQFAGSPSLMAQIQAQLPAKTLTASQYQRLLQIYSNAARGKGKIFQDLDTAQQRMVAARVAKALQQDLNDAISVGGLPGGVAEALTTARQNYAINSKAVQELGKSTLGRMLGDRSGEFSAERLVASLESMKGDQIKRVFSMLEAASPDDAQLVKRGLMERLIERAQPTEEVLARRFEAGHDVGEGLSPARFLTQMRRSPLWNVLEGPERFQLNQIVQGMQRLANRGGTEGSPTAPLLFAKDFAIALARAVGGLDLISAGHLATSIMAPRQLAQTIVSPGGQRAWATTLNEMSRPRGRNTRALLNALMFLAGRPVTEPAGQNVRPSAELNAVIGSMPTGRAAPRNLMRPQAGARP